MRMRLRSAWEKGKQKHKELDDIREMMLMQTMDRRETVRSIDNSAVM